jgi:hypothetical protein
MEFGIRDIYDREDDDPALTQADEDIEQADDEAKPKKRGRKRPAPAFLKDKKDSTDRRPANVKAESDY